MQFRNAAYAKELSYLLGERREVYELYIGHCTADVA